MASKQIGWVIKHRTDRNWHLNIRVYSSAAVANRYANGSPVLPCFIEEPEEIKLDNSE